MVRESEHSKLFIVSSKYLISFLVCLQVHVNCAGMKKKIVIPFIASRVPLGRRLLYSQSLLCLDGMGRDESMNVLNGPE